ncbi:MAG: RNA polymerase sigma factor [Terriglobia bacterium]
MTAHLANEPRLVDAAKMGDDEAFSILANQYYKNIYRLALRITGNHEDAEDTSQEALMKAYCNLRVFQGKSRFYTWLVRIVMNEALMKLRKRRSNRQVSLDEVVYLDADTTVPREIVDSQQDPEKRYAEVEFEETLAAALENLGPRLTAAFQLRNVEELSVKETADALGISMSAVKSRLLRARCRLRLRLKRVHPKVAKRRLTPA